MGFFPDTEDWADLVRPECLTRKFAIDDYHAQYMEQGHVEKADLDKDAAMLKAKMLPGDEWWEWVMGTEPLMQMGGIALVRCGQVIWARNDWIS